jgi:hypothetical protein
MDNRASISGEHEYTNFSQRPILLYLHDLYLGHLDMCNRGRSHLRRELSMRTDSGFLVVTDLFLKSR